MNKQRMFWLILSAMLVMSLLLVACQPATPQAPAEEPAAEEPAEEPDVEEPAEEPAMDEKPFEGVELNLLQETVPDLDYFREYIPEFEEQTGMKVNIEEVTYTAMHEKLVPQLSLGEGQGSYDVIEVDKQWVGEFMCADWLLPLDDYIAADGFDTSVYVPALFDMIGQVNGVTYMLPYYNYTTGLVYRTDIFEDPEIQAAYEEEFGKPLEVPATLDEYVETAKFLTMDTDDDGEIDQYGAAMQLARFPSYGEFAHLLFVQDGWYYDDEWNAAVNDEKGMKAINSLIDMYQNATTEAATGYFFNEQLEFFNQGNAAMIITYSVMPALIDNPEFSEVAGKIDLSTAPFGMQGGWGWAIPKSAPNPEAAWEFIKWVESPEIAKKRAMLGGAATRLDVLEDPEVLAAFPFQETIREWLKTGKPFPIVCRSQEIIDTLSLNVSEALAGTKDPQAAMDEAAAVLNDIVAEDPLVNK